MHILANARFPLSKKCGGSSQEEEHSNLAQPLLPRQDYFVYTSARVLVLLVKTEYTLFLHVHTEYNLFILYSRSSSGSFPLRVERRRKFLASYSLENVIRKAQNPNVVQPFAPLAP